MTGPHRSIALSIAAIGAVAAMGICAPAGAQGQSSGQTAKTVRTFSRPDRSCPPVGLQDLYQWDDGKGNDLALEVTCMPGSPGYYSLRLSQSRNGHYTTVASPRGDGGQTRTADC
ncbi:MAG: hypothetical protein NVS3B7_09410 [Candidatus Elarobacter sp.]